MQPSPCSSSPAAARCLFTVELRLPMDGAHAKIFGSDDTPVSASDAMGGDFWNDKIVPYLDADYGNDWDFADKPFNSHADICASLYSDFDAISRLKRLADVAVSEDGSRVFSSAFAEPKAITEPNTSVASEAAASERWPLDLLRRLVWVAIATRCASRWNISTWLGSGSRNNLWSRNSEILASKGAGRIFFFQGSVDVGWWARQGHWRPSFPRH